MKLRLLAVSALLIAGCAPAPMGVPGAASAEPATPSESAPESAEESTPAAASEAATSEAPAAEPPSSESVAPEETTAAPSAEASTEESVDPTPAPEASPEATTSESPTAVEESPIAEITDSPEPVSPGEGWQVLDANVRQTSEVAALPVDEAIKRYLTSRLEEPCNVEFTIYATNGRFMIADESGTCAGNALMTYGPATGGEVAELVEFTQVQPCEAFESEGLPPGVPQTDKLPDGLVCGSGDRY